MSAGFGSALVGPLGAPAGCGAAAGDVVGLWANDGEAINAIAKRVVRNTGVFMAPILFSASPGVKLQFGGHPISLKLRRGRSQKSEVSDHGAERKASATSFCNNALISPERQRVDGNSALPDTQTLLSPPIPWIAVRPLAPSACRNNRARLRPDRISLRGSSLSLVQLAIFSYISISAEVDFLTRIIRIVAPR